MTVLFIMTSVVLFAGLIFLMLKYQRLISKYKGIIDVDKEIDKRKIDLNNLQNKFNGIQGEFDLKAQKLGLEYISKRNVYEQLLKEVSSLEENLENISYGFYNPHFDYTTSEEFKKKLEEIRNKQKELIKSEQATYCPIEWSVEGSKAKGKKMTKESSKLMLRAFNGECDSAIAKVSWNNISIMEARINKAFDALNKLGSTNKISITSQYYDLKLKELYLEFELEEKLQQEKEEQRRIKEQMREEEKALREIEKAKKEAEEEEKRYQKALEKAKAELVKAKGEELEELNKKIQELEASLQLVHAQKERAISMAQMTKSGHVYIISNIGSFGENVYKIGMTRRLEPMDRVKELGGASVPFDFDVHALIYSDNAPELENKLHQSLDHNRVNLVNTRREFFRVSLDEIEELAKELKLDMHVTRLAEAKEYRESESLIIARNSKRQVEVLPELEKFPTNLN